MKESILKPRQEAWLTEVAERLGELRAALARCPADESDESTIEDAIGRLRELFLIVIVGEFNAGKSAFINALLGDVLLEEGVVPTTTRIQILKHGETRDRHVVDEYTQVVTAPAALLLQLNVVDTPGTNAIDRGHEALTQEFIPRADLVLFVTSADRPFTESERAFLQKIREWGKKIVFVVNKIDILEHEEERDRVAAYVRENAENLLGHLPDVFAVSARAIVRSRNAGAAVDGSAGQFLELENYVTNTLDEQERVRLKLLSPLGVGERLGAKYLAAVDEQKRVLEADLTAIAEIDRSLEMYEEDMSREFNLRMAEVDNTLHELEDRGREFIEDVVRLPRLFDLLNKERLKAGFERKVVNGAPEAIERRVNDLIDWLVSSELQQWETIKDQVARRRSARSVEAVGDFAVQFNYDRGRLMESVGRTAQRTLENYDREGEARRMAESAQAAVAGTAMLEVGAIGLGAAIAAVASSTAADVTGVLVAGVMATLGFLVIPQRRRKAKQELKNKIAALREQLKSALGSQFDEELRRSLNRMRDSMAPYSRFVRSEEKSITAKRDALETAMRKIRTLRSEIEEAG